MRGEPTYSRSQFLGNELVHSHLILVAEGFDVGDRDFGEQAPPVVGPVQPDNGSRRREREGSLLAWTRYVVRKQKERRRGSREESG